jgi:hypothetical protein
LLNDVEQSLGLPLTGISKEAFDIIVAELVGQTV